MKINHCNIDFQSYDVWFLFDNATDKNRRLLLGKCPVCKKDIVSLVEERKKDGRIFVQKEVGTKATKLIDDALRKKDVVYSESELKIRQGNGAPFGLCYGETKEIRNHKGQVVKIRVKRCDFFGQEKVIKEEAVAV